jgi:hypothetical protein
MLWLSYINGFCNPTQTKMLKSLPYIYTKLNWLLLFSENYLNPKTTFFPDLNAKKKYFYDLYCKHRKICQWWWQTFRFKSDKHNWSRLVRNTGVSFKNLMRIFIEQIYICYLEAGRSVYTHKNIFPRSVHVAARDRKSRELLGPRGNIFQLRADFKGK